MTSVSGAATAAPHSFAPLPMLDGIAALTIRIRTVMAANGGAVSAD